MNNFRVAQKAFIENYKGEVLVVRFSKNEMISTELQGCWDFPGGGLQENETMQDGLLREIKEELGNVQVEIGVPMVTWDFYMKSGSKQRCIVIGYLAKWKGGAIMLNAEHDAYRWMKPHELPQLKWSSDEKFPVQEYIRHSQRSVV